jgi:outer membrane assembly lipoprotein YfiO
MARTLWRLAAAMSVVAVAACRPEFKIKNLTSNDALYKASMAEYQKHHWDNAITGFEKLTTDLPPRDSLLPRSYWYLASSHEHSGEHLLAAQSYSRLVESFPEDSLADDAALEAARAYKRLWRKPGLDAAYGETAIASYNTLIGLYPDSPLIPAAQKDIAELENWFAIKDYDAGNYYFKRKAYDSGIIYFKDVLTKYPNSPTAREAALRLVKAYKAIRYKEDASELCGQMVARYQKDREVADVCSGVQRPVAQIDTTRPAATAGKPPVY